MYIENIDGLYGLRAGLDAQPCRGGRPGTRDLCSRNKGDGRLNSDSNVKGWLFTILRNIWLNQLRRQRTARIVAIDEEENETNSSETANDP
jgi:RNA polymerase sigma-70 factor (ECF subfamily)